MADRYALQESSPWGYPAWLAFTQIESTASVYDFILSPPVCAIDRRAQGSGALKVRSTGRPLIHNSNSE